MLEFLLVLGRRMGTIQMFVSPSEHLGERVSVALASCLSLLGLVWCYITPTCAPMRGSVKLGCLQFRLAGLIKCFGVTDSSSALLCSQDSLQWLVKVRFPWKGIRGHDSQSLEFTQNRGA